MAFTYIPDYPAKEPSFDYKVVAKGLAPLLLRPSDPGATVVGIHGPWGAGKTTLMAAIQREIEAEVPYGISIEFNAWKFQDREALWRALILHILGELRRVKAQSWLKGNPGKKIDDFEDPKLCQVEDKLYRAFSVEERGPWKVQWRTLIVELVTIGLSVFKLGFVSTALKGSKSWMGRLFGGLDDKGGKETGESGLKHDRVKELAGVLERDVLHRQVNQVQSIEQFLAEFSKLIGEFSKEWRRVFVFIDDLDRCLPESALEIFEAIKLFLDAPGIAYVIALDRDTIRKALAVRYARQDEADRGQSLLDPDEYIEKTISVSFDLPKLSEEDAIEFIQEVELPCILDDARRKAIVRALGTNPRRLRRFMNALSVNLHIAEGAGEAGKLALEPASLDLFLKLLLISYRYSGIFSMVRENPDLLIGLQKIANVYSGNKDKQAARKARNDLLDKESPLMAKLAEKEDFWTVMALPPQLNDDEKAMGNMLNWFRYRVPKATKQV
jgi:hypothetical protein